MPHAAIDLLWAGAASTLHRVRGGEGALLAINLSLIVVHLTDLPRALAQTIVSLLAIALMYALNDLFDAPADAKNPKKDQALVSTYLVFRAVGFSGLIVLKIATILFTYLVLDPGAAVAVAAVLIVNAVYSARLKGVPVADVVWCGLWGALYAAIVVRQPELLLVVGLMTAICHLYQALDDRVADAANAINTTAVRSASLSRNVLTILCLLLFFAIRVPLGSAVALSAFIPLAIYLSLTSARAGWLWTKVYFGVLWLGLLGIYRALG